MQKFLFIFFCAIVFWAPIPLGSHRIWSAAILETLICCLFIIIFSFKDHMCKRDLNLKKKGAKDSFGLLAASQLACVCVRVLLLIHTPRSSSSSHRGKGRRGDWPLLSLLYSDIDRSVETFFSLPVVLLV